MSEIKNEQPEPENAATSRRDFLKLAGGLAVAAGVAQVAMSNMTAKASSGGEEGKGPQWGMLIDINLCIGCQYCTFACEAVNNLADDMRYCVVTNETTQSGQEFLDRKSVV